MLDQTTSTRFPSSTRWHADDAWDKTSRWVLFVVPAVFVILCVLLVSLWCVDLLDGWLIVTFVLLLEAMLLGVCVFMFALTTVSHLRLRRAKDSICCSGRPIEADASASPDEIEGMQAVRCMPKSGPADVFQVRCYNTHCPRIGCRGGLAPAAHSAVTLAASPHDDARDEEVADLV
ncbi:hypothetical protein KDW10_07600 [Burkholderia vietnamiensis]|uniref:hypothetical protein n=1 Tax=Burkholderia vietnamiensis TaxID=60552 RepID=UPI000ACF1845|nr:hypothetical protein [Burkholderia vietnamiensis]MBR8357218.1 hypothetical protein [Burkholderia vietnamiensis]